MSFNITVNGSAHTLTFKQPDANIDGSDPVDVGGGYRLYVGTENDPNSFFGFQDLNTDPTPVTITGVPAPGTVYYFAVSGINSSGFESKHSNLVPLAVNP